jgi:hypothetical protein
MTLPRRVDGEPLQMATEDGNGGASNNDNIEEDDDGSQGGEPSSSDGKDGRMGGFAGVNNNGMGCAVATVSAYTASSTTPAGVGGGY